MLQISIQLLILAILTLVLIVVLVDERRVKLSKSPNAKMTGYWDGAERRGGNRVTTPIDTKYYIDKKPRQIKDSLGKNISNTGILMQMNEKLLPSTQLLLDISLPNDKKPIIAKGEVVWVKEQAQSDQEGRRLFDIGIKFVTMSQKDKERLGKHIQKVS